ncbi:flagellar basal body L-ring protein FlgH [Sporomusa aerivorans]|uniref:flagellar basal body L-ring protein FlgH n=1 Tax=Sporomusa aerivorans TaxID=204936 RepID=UPI00352A0577
MRKLIAFLLVLTGMILPVPHVQAESLWSENTPAANLFIDHRAHAVGDIVTIIISESSSATRKGNTSNSKSASTNVDAGSGLLTFINSVTAGSEDSFTANGSISNTNSVTGRLTVKIIEVKPNGQMVVQGTQSIRQNSDTQKITITGIIRPEDVSSDNTIVSNKVADAELKIEGKGPISRKQRQGVITQLFDLIF